MADETDNFDYSAYIRPPAVAASSKLASVADVTPDAAATGLQHGPTIGQPPIVAARSPQQTQQLAAGVAQQQALKDPRNAVWAAHTDPAHLAAAKDDLASLSRIANVIDPLAQSQEAAHPFDPDYFKNAAAMGGQHTLVGDLGGSVLDSAAGAVHGFFASIREAGRRIDTAQQQGNALGVVNNLLGSAFGYYGVGKVDDNNALSVGIDGKRYGVQHTTGAFENLLGAAFSATPLGAGIAAANEGLNKTNLLPKDFLAANAWVLGEHGNIFEHLPGRGADATTDALRGAVATVDAAHATEVQGAIAASPIHARSPSTVEDFIHSRLPDRTVHVDPDAVIEHVLAQGHDLPWPELAPQLARAVADGNTLEVPFERYHTALADKPYAEALNANTIFREGGMTLENAKAAKPVGDAELEATRGGATDTATLSEITQQDATRRLNDFLDREITSGDEDGLASAIAHDLRRVQDGELDPREALEGWGLEEKREPAPSRAAPEAPSDLTPEEADRFRTLAARAEQATEQVFREQYLTPQPIEHAPAVGMTEAELATYGDRMRAASEEARAQAAEAAYRQIKRERAPEWKEAVAKHTEDGRAEVEGQRNVTVRRLLADDKLDSDLVKAKYPDLAERLPKDIHDKLGLVPDEALAEHLGYGSMREMLNDQAFLHQAVNDAGARNLDDYVSKRAKAIGQARAEQQLGEGFFNPEALKELAMSLVPEDKALGTLIDDFRYLAKMTGRDAFNVGDAKAQAKDSFQGQQVGNVTNLQRLNENIFRTAQKAQQALAKENFGSAWGYKQIQFKQRLQLKEALAFRRTFDKAVKQWGKLAGSRTLAGMDQTALNFIHAIQAELGYAVSSHAADLPKIADLPTYIDARNRAGGELIRSDIPPRDPAKSLGRNLGQMTVEQFNGLKDMIDSIAADGRNQQRVTRAGKARAVDDVRSATISSLNRFDRDIGREEREDPTLLQKLDSVRRGWDAAMVRMEQLIRDFTARNPDHPLMELWHEMMDRKGWKDDKLIAMSKHFEALGKQIGKGFDEWLTARVGEAEAGTGYMPVATKSGDRVFITNKDIVVAALHMGDEAALRKFAEGYDTTPAAIEAIVHKHMTDDAWTYVQGMWDAFGTMSQDAQAAYLHRSGVHLQMVEPRPFTVPKDVQATAGRKLTGGYYPIAYDWDNLPQNQKQMLQSDEVLGAKEFRTFTPQSNYLKARTGFTGPIDMSLDMALTRLRQMAHDLAFRDVLVDLQKVLLHDDVKQAIATKYGPEYIDTIENYIKAVAGAETGGGRSMRTLTRAINYLSNAQQISLIGFNPGTVLKHGLTAAVHSMQTVGPAEFLRSSVDLYRGGGDLRAQLDAESSELRFRHLNANERARDYFEKLQGENNWRATLKRASVWAITELDKESARQVYMAAKQGELDRQQALGQPIDNDKAVAVGNQMVRQAHGSTGVTDTAQILRADDSLWGAIASSETRFMNFFNHNYNRMREIPQAFGYAGEEPDVARGLGLLLTYGILTGTIGAVTAGEFKAAKGGINWLGGLVGSALHVTADAVPVVSTIANAATWAAGGFKGTPRAGMLMQFGIMYGRVAYDLAQVIGAKHGGATERRHIENLIADGTNAVGTTFQLPANAISKIQRFAFQQLDPQAQHTRRTH